MAEVTLRRGGRGGGDGVVSSIDSSGVLILGLSPIKILPLEAYVPREGAGDEGCCRVPEFGLDGAGVVGFPFEREELTGDGDEGRSIAGDGEGERPNIGEAGRTFGGDDRLLS